MAGEYIVAFDQGTTSCRALLITRKGTIAGMAQQEFSQVFPQPGWIEHDPMEILDVQLNVFREVLEKNQISGNEIKAIGITNQRETTVVWDRNTGKPVYNAIVWQDTRTASICETLKKEGLTEYVRNQTGLVIDAYFSATKIKWILDHVEGAREKAENGDLLFGTIDSWLVWHLTKGSTHITDYSNASRTMLYNINTLKWDTELLNVLDIPETMLPEVKPSAYLYGHYEVEGHTIPIAGIAGDQQAALFGQACFEKGTAKNTYGTGCFMLMNTGKKPQYSKNGLLTTIAWGLGKEITYALEGSIFMAGAAIQWLRDGLEIIDTAPESEDLAVSIPGDNPVYVVPAFAGLGAPYWDMYARGAIFGLTRDTGKAHIAKATLESLAYQTKDILDAMQQDAGIELASLKVDGGAATNNYLMQFQANILGVEVYRPQMIESTAIGAAYLAGITLGWWTQEEIHRERELQRVFVPAFSKEKRTQLYKRWLKAIERTKNWHEE